MPDHLTEIERHAAALSAALARAMAPGARQAIAIDEIRQAVVLAKVDLDVQAAQARLDAQIAAQEAEAEARRQAAIAEAEAQRSRPPDVTSQRGA